MGCFCSMFSAYTPEEVEAELAALTPRLPIATLMNGGIIKLEGVSGFFNPNSLLDEKWLNGKMTAVEYYNAINHINRCTAQTQIGLSKAYFVSEKPQRDQIKTQAGLAAVQQLNERHPAVRFTYQQTAEDVPMDMSYSTDPTVQYMNRHQRSVGHGAKTVLYINVNL